MFDNSTILVTGGTGSFGRRCISYILENYKPQKLIVFSRDELKQYKLANVLDHKALRFFIGDVRDFERLKMAMRDVDFVIHAAALKHVPVAEYNPMECIKTNIYGAENVVNASIACNVKKIIALSTDKAANPINLYGATKLCSDKIFIAANNLVPKKQSTLFSVVRYGNVVGSSGSVLPFFQKLVADGAPYFPITHEKMTRFWITLSQGVEFVLSQFDKMQGGEIFLPKMPSIRIVDLAEALEAEKERKIVGMRPGEKLHEVLIPKDEARFTLEFQEYFSIMPSITIQNLDSYQLDKYNEAVSRTVMSENFEYTSQNNSKFLNVKEIKKIIQDGDEF